MTITIQKEALDLQEHISALRAKHATMDEAIRIESARPMPDFFIIAELKKKKLALKQEIGRLTQDAA